MSDRLAELARRIQDRPWNRPGTDKTWVLLAMWDHLRFREEVRAARRADGVDARAKAVEFLRAYEARGSEDDESSR